MLSGIPVPATGAAPATALAGCHAPWRLVVLQAQGVNATQQVALTADGAPLPLSQFKLPLPLAAAPPSSSPRGHMSRALVAAGGAAQRAVAYALPLPYNVAGQVVRSWYNNSQVGVWCFDLRV